MSIFNKIKRKKARADPNNKSWLCSSTAYETLCCTEYTRLSDNPEIVSAVNKICDLISSMTIYQMENTEKGDVRIKDGLSRLLDINPNANMTRKTFIFNIVKNLLLDGDGNSVVYPKTNQGYLYSMDIIPPSQINILQHESGYRIYINGQPYNPNDLLHFVINPNTTYPWKGTGYKTTLKDIAGNLKQASRTKNGFMKSKWKPSVIVRVDSNSDELANPEGRRRILEDYIANTEAGTPWVIPSELFEVETVKPLSLTDLALSDAVTLDKKTVAAILDVPECIVGTGTFNKDEWNNFINTRIKGICDVLAQEFTRKLLISPTRYFKFNPRSVYAYNISEIASVGGQLVDRMAMRRNELRDWLGFSPDPEMDELLALENYIPVSRLGDQNKLQGGEDHGTEDA